MKEILINKLIFENKPLYDINIGDDVLVSLNKLNIKREELVGENNFGYYYLSNGFRIGVSEKVIDEIGIDFLQSNVRKILLKDIEGEINLKNAKIHKVLNYFNDRFISWEPIKNIDKSALVIRINEKDLYFIFDIYKGTLDKIIKTKKSARLSDSNDSKDL